MAAKKKAKKTPKKASAKATKATKQNKAKAPSLALSWGNPPESSPLHTRAKYIQDDIGKYVEKAFKKNPKYKSAVLAVSQYFADEAIDAVHGKVVFSENEAPIWPHACQWRGREAQSGSNMKFDRGERCSSCGRSGSTWLPFDSNGQGIVGFQSCCLESQDEGGGDYTPYVIYRRTKTGFETEIIGAPVRAWFDDDDASYSGLEYDEADPVEPRDPTESRKVDKDTSALLELVCKKPEDDAPRAVLADHLLGRNEKDALGEYITLSLSPKKADPARMRELVAENIAAWLGPIFDVASPECVELDRGFVKKVAVHIPDAKEKKRVLAAAEWGSIEDVWFLPQSQVGFSANMKSLRRVGGLDGKSLATLGKELAQNQIDRLERLDVALDGKKAVDTLLKMKLPALRVLAIQGDDNTSQEVRNPFTGETYERVSYNAGSADLGPKALSALASSKLFGQLDELILLSMDPTGIKAWCERAAKQRPKTLTFSSPSPIGAPSGLRLRITSGNEAVLDVPAFGDMQRVGQVVMAIPSSMKIKFVSTKWFAPTKKEIDGLKKVTKKEIAIQDRA
jgi:uncharacterized protein (TIGR02996 family)